MSYGTKYTILPPDYARGYERYDVWGLHAGGDVVLGRKSIKHRKNRRGCPQAFTDKQQNHIDALLSELRGEEFTLPKFHKPKRRYVACRNEERKMLYDDILQEA